MISIEYDGKPTGTDRDLAPKIIGCTPRAEVRQHVGFQEITGSNLLRHEKATECKAVTGRRDRSSEGSLGP